ncbi:MAG: TonB-dependent receptor [Bacteroidales bacterium]|nr:TonB-dependent receptor [Candidatus Cryptobacteroides onthequi]
MNLKKFAASLLSMALFMGMALTAFAQNTVKGTVVDKNGEPVIGAAILVLEDATKGAIADADGAWSLVAAPGNTLQVQAIGYKTLETKVTSSVMNIVIEEDVNLLDDVVVIGYGTARKGDLTGAIGSVNGSKIAERSATMLSTALQGQVAGLQVTRTAGGPGSSSTLRVRGVTNMTTNDPLVIIDGVPGSINDVLAADVESITVLKDAASAAIYGARAAAGVVLVTTKRAKDGKFNIDYNYSYAIDTPTTTPKNGDVIDWMMVTNEVNYNDGMANFYNTYSEETINGWMAKNAEDPYHYPNTDWVGLMLKKTSSHQDHAVSIQGGTDRLRTKVNLNYQNADGYFANRSYERFAGRVNNDYKINKWINASFNIDFSKSEAISPNLGNPIYWAYLNSPYYPAYWEDGSYAEGKSGTNSLAMLNEGGTNSTQYYKVGGKAQIDLTPVKGLTITAIAAPRYTFTKYKKFQKLVYNYREDGSAVVAQGFSTNTLTEKRNDSNSVTYQAYANYQTKLGNHSLNATLGYEAYAYEKEDLEASREKYELTNFPYLSLGPEDYQYNKGTANHNAYQSVFGRLMYSFKDRYMLQANFRNDYSSRFHKDYRSGFFPSVSAGWVISEEPWFNVKNVDYLKLRASIGQLGNEQISDSYFPYQAVIKIENAYLSDANGVVTPVKTAAQQVYAFNDITWETTTTYGVGLDANFFGGRLRTSADVYHKRTDNMLLDLAFPSYVGFSAPKQNAGIMYTNGWEIEIGWNDQVGDFSYGVNFNLSDYRSKMGDLKGKTIIDGNYITEEGSYYKEWYMYQSDGLFYTAADLVDENGNKYPVLTGKDKEGCIKYVNQNDDTVINADDKVKLGNSLPEYIFGGNVNLGYKNFDFNMSFAGVGHQNSLFKSYWIQPRKEQWGAVPQLVVGNCWSSQNTEEQNRKAKYPMMTWSNTTNTFAGSDYWLFNGAYFRVKNMTLGYTVPKHIISKTKVLDNLRVYASVTDLPAISNYPKGWDPELDGNSAEFISTSFIFGVNVKF